MRRAPPRTSPLDGVTITRHPADAWGLLCSSHEPTGFASSRCLPVIASFEVLQCAAANWRRRALSQRNDHPSHHPMHRNHMLVRCPTRVRNLQGRAVCPTDAGAPATNPIRAPLSETHSDRSSHPAVAAANSTCAGVASASAVTSATPLLEGSVPTIAGGASALADPCPNTDANSPTLSIISTANHRGLSERLMQYLMQKYR